MKMLLLATTGDYLGLAFFAVVVLMFAILFFRIVRKNNQASASLGLDENGDPVIGQNDEIPQVEPLSESGSPQA